ncbi:MAG: L-lysine 6-transaminase [Candidatus Latescibacterota bacterium]|nr:MAG: L-lysine 6-transaminase [Candidatus Latescibacterota bacterium]
MPESKILNRIAPDKVHETLRQSILVDGFDVVVDLEKSRGVRLFDARSQRPYLDMFSCFASAPLGFNHPRLSGPEFVAMLGRMAITKPSNSDLYSVEMAEFVDTFARLARPEQLPHLFFVEGGALGVENALKTAMDWKVRKNLAAGRGEKGHRVIHFRECFHGRTGYTLSLTNTDPVKTMYFSQFDWPRIRNPKLTFPVTPAVVAETEQAEAEAVHEIEQAFQEYEHDICAIILEPIQGEGGDNHFRAEFFPKLRKLADEHDALLIFDEVQTGLGLTGRMWAFEHYGVQPDAIAFGKKTQVCGTAVGRRVDEVEDNVFRVSSRLNSTWAGNLIDMIRCQRILEVMEEENLVENAARVGEELLQGLQAVSNQQAEKISNARGLGLMCAFDVRDADVRKKLLRSCHERGLMLIGCGERTVRFRPALTVQSADIAEALDILGQAASAL